MRSAIAGPYRTANNRPRLLAVALLLAAALVLAPAAGAATMLYIRGGGYGHGIGMSQYGAYGYALHGKDYRFILAHYYQGTTLGTTSAKRTVRVLLASGSASFSGATRAAGKQLKPSLTYEVRALPDGSLALSDQHGKVIAHSPAPLTATGPGPLSADGLGLYRGSLEYRPDGSGGVETIDAVGLDDYVRGVISAEMPAGWSADALKAQAVAARTYAITTNVGGAGFDLYPDTRSQMYRGVAAETTATNAAVAATRGQIVTYHGTPAVTYFFASSGGHTENVENVWPGATPQAWLRGVPDPYDGAGGDPYHRWRYALTPASAQSKLGTLVKGQLIGVRVTKHGVSPRIIRADVVGTRGSTTVTGSQLQSAFGLMSTYATFTTITTLAGQSPTPARPGPFTLGVYGLAAALAPGVHGSVFPAKKGGPLTIEVKGPTGWRSTAHVRLGAHGSYSAAVPGAGTYRVVYRGSAGPAVSAP